jgi:hypothetical protein
VIRRYVRGEQSPVMLGAFAGPDVVPAEAFADELHAAVRAA